LNVNYQEEFEDTKGVTRICISKKNRLHNGQPARVVILDGVGLTYGV